MKKPGFPAILTSSEKVVLTESPTLVKLSEKILFIRTCSLDSPLWGNIFFFEKKVHFREVGGSKVCLKWTSLDYEKIEFLRISKLYALTSLVFNETLCIQVSTY